MQKEMSYFRRFGVKEFRRSENISDEKCYLYRSTRLHPYFVWSSSAIEELSIAFLTQKTILEKTEKGKTR